MGLGLGVQARGRLRHRCQCDHAIKDDAPMFSWMYHTISAAVSLLFAFASTRVHTRMTTKSKEFEGRMG